MALADPTALECLAKLTRGEGSLHRDHVKPCCGQMTTDRISEGFVVFDKEYRALPQLPSPLGSASIEFSGHGQERAYRAVIPDLMMGDGIA